MKKGGTLMQITKKCEKKLFKLDIMAEMALSDTIINYQRNYWQHYLNLSTGMCEDEKEKVIRSGIPYICVEKENQYSKQHGFLTKYIEEYDAALSVFYSLEENSDGFRWEEMFRIIIGRNGFEMQLSKSGISKFGEDTNLIKLLKSYNDSVDLCGQNIYGNFNIQGQSWEELCKLIGGCWKYSIGGDQTTVHDKCDIFRVVCKFSLYKELNPSLFSVRQHDMDGIEPGPLFIPEKKQEIISHAAYTAIQREKAFGNISEENCFINGLHLSVLQNCGGEYVLRHFAAVIKGLSENEYELEMNYVEIERIHITNSIANGCMYLLKWPLLYFDREGINDGKFRYAKNFLEEAERNTELEITRNLIIHPKYQCSSFFCNINAAYAVSCVPVFEKLISFLKTNNMGGKYTEIGVNGNCSLMEISKRCMYSLKGDIEKIIGPLNFEKSELHQIIGLPKASMKMLLETCDFFTGIKNLKELFEGNESYLNSMNSSDLQKVISFMDNNHNSMACTQMTCLKMMISIFGPKNVTGYCNFLMKLEKYETEANIVLYKQYLEKISLLKNFDCVDRTQWKLRGVALEKAYESIETAFETLNDMENYPDMMKSFKKQYPCWERYRYKGKDFSVIYPNGPTELIEEGARLHHCAKQFLKLVAEGKTTILFVRRNNSPQKPFFTLEIRDGCVRQCHGYANSNIDKIPKLHDFLDEFCQTKGIRVDWELTDRQLGED